MKQIRNALSIFAAAVLLVVVPAVTAVHAQCTNATLSGNYAATSQGFTTKKAPAGHEVPVALMGVVTFDGAGNISVTYTNVLNGVISTNLASSGTYSVNSDCTASWLFTSGDAAGGTANLAIIGGGAEVFAIVTVPTFTLSFDLKKQ